MGKKVPPLKSRTLTLNQLQLEVLDLIRKVRFQFGRMPHQEGMSDDEFLEKVVSPLEDKIYADRAVLRMHKNSGRIESEGD